MPTVDISAGEMHLPLEMIASSRGSISLSHVESTNTVGIMFSREDMPVHYPLIGSDWF
jgi:hypothetical protein